jgi:hypothetical protein
MLTKRHLRWRLLVLALAPAGLAACAGASRQEQAYCYRTLADVSCYQAPDVGREAQLVGVYVPDRSPKDEPAGETAGTEREGWLAGMLLASGELVGRILAPVGPIVGLFR